MKDKANKANFLGNGWSFPPTFLRSARTVSMTEGKEDIDRSLEILLSTSLGERVMHPEYGSNLQDLLFEPIDTAFQTLLIDRIQSAILYYEPRIETEGIILDTSRVTEGVILIEINYRIRSTNSRFNFVYPFYKNEGSEIQSAS
ncbi:MAG: GPW/gp25 family protein [Phaeodactylibacter sp.]|nr:GPW/gp25 family protein [Phaeodactylibacter sp.]MCB9049770.1 GPW/gp25 family protein [Lewinellaceae bacterium]